MKYQIKNGSVTIESNTILEEINIEILDRSKIGIVGKNGAGKTTLLKTLINNELLDEGIGEEKLTITKTGNINIGYLEQINFTSENNTMIEELTNSYKELINIEKKLEKLVNTMNNNYNLIEEYTNLEETYRLLGGYTYKKEIEVIINKFKFSESDKYKKIKSFSGGQKTKIALMKLLLSKPSILLLDEPTNHLDIETIEWLEEYLKNYKSAIVLVSHDRTFINNIVNIIYDIDYGRVVKYSGNYEYYEKEKQKNYEKLLKNYLYQQKEITRLTNIYKRFRSKPTKAKMALSKLKQIERMDIIEKPNNIEEKTFSTNLDNIAKSGRIVLTTKNLVIGYDKPLVEVNIELERGRKLGIIGKNGTGKSTLLKTIYKRITPLSGTFNYGTNVSIGYFDQNLSTLNNNNTVLEEFHNTFPMLSEEECRNALGSFLFKGEDVFKKTCILSGGEKVRLELCKILYNKPNLLILDEPTNHMDIVGKEHLENILEKYPGTIVFVSHDRYFINKVADSLLIFKDNKVEYFPYSYKEYLEKRNNTIYNKKNNISPKKESKKINTYNINKDIKRIEQDITKLELEIKKLNKELYQEDNYNDYIKINKINNEINKKTKELEELNNKWEKLIEKI